MTLTLKEREAGRLYRKGKARVRKEAKKARPKSEKASRGRVLEPGFLAFLRRQPCSVCRRPAPCDAAHIRTPKPGEPPTGLARKPNDRRATSLCRSCHEYQHSMSELKFWRQFGLDPFEVASAHYARFQAEGAR